MSPTKAYASRIPSAATAIKWIDRFFIALQALAATFQILGSFLYTELGSNLFAWSLSGALIPTMLVAINCIRNARPHDREVAYLALLGNCAWMFFILMFGKTQGSMLDVRIVLHATAAFALTAFSAYQISRFETHGRN